MQQKDKLEHYLSHQDQRDRVDTWSWNQSASQPASAAHIQQSMENVDLSPPSSLKPQMGSNGGGGIGRNNGADSASSSSSSAASAASSWGGLDEVKVQPPRSPPKKMYKPGHHMKTVQGVTFWLIAGKYSLWINFQV